MLAPSSKLAGDPEMWGTRLSGDLPMESMFETARVEELKQRLARLRPDSERQWGTMTAAQAVAHCSKGIEMAVGEIRPPLALAGRLLGRVIKPMALREGEPMRRNSPTSKELIVGIGIGDDRDLDAERERLRGLIDRFAGAGPAGCTSHPHPFFGRLTPDEWGVLMYKHLDHHLRQFGV
jgi:hypothetical protein